MATQPDQAGTSQGIFVNEVKQMMYIFGDVKTPSTESALLIEDFTLKHMRDLIKSAGKVSSIRNGGSNVSITDILFLFRKDTNKLKRIVNNIDSRDIGRRASMEDEDIALVDHANKQNKNFSLDFLSAVEREEVLSSEIDEVQRNRLEGLDSLTKDMTVDEYKEFSVARQSGNFHKNMGRFKEWLDIPSVYPSLSVNLNAFPVLGYLAYDSVQEIVELAMLIKQTQEGDLSHSFYRPPSSVTMATTTSSTPLFFNISPTNSSTNESVNNVATATTTGPSSASSPPTSPRTTTSPGGASSLSSPTQIVTKPKPRKRGRPPKNSTSSSISDSITPQVSTTPLAPPTALQPFHVLEAMRRRSFGLTGPMVSLKTHSN